MNNRNTPIILNDDTVHLCIARLSHWKTKSNELGSILSTEEKKRAERLIIPDRREDFIIQRGVTRLILSRYLEHKPEDIPISISKSGKPYLSDSNIQFNISHSNDILICGISTQKRIGVDIQHIYPIKDLDRIKPKILTPSEIELLDKTPEEDTNDMFFTIWAAKEAYIKGLGSGFQSPVNTVQIFSEKDNSIFLQVEDDPSEFGWTIQEVQIDLDYKTIIAVEGDNYQLETITFTPETHQIDLPV